MNNGWESLERTKTEQLDPILSLSGLHTRSHRLFWVLFVPIFVFLRTLFDPVYPYSFASVEMGGNHWKGLEGTEQVDPILSLIALHTSSQVST